MIYSRSSISVQPETEAPLPNFKAEAGGDIESIRTSDALDESQKSELQELLVAYKDIFSQIPGKTTLLECCLELTTSEPINTPQYPLPFSMKKIVERQVNDMLQLGVIERSNSPYNSPLVLVKKPDKTYRACNDFRHINSVLVSDAEPIPGTGLMFAEVGNKLYFSKLDLTKGYWQVPLEKKSRAKTAFSTQSGHYQFLFMPFGIKTASAIFTRLMRTLLDGLNNIVHYIDDVLIATFTWEEHINTLRQLFESIRSAGLTVKPQKCEIETTSIIILGHLLGGNKIEPVDSTIEKIPNAPKPETNKQVLSFLGLMGYYRDLIPQYAVKARPLVELTRKRESSQVISTPQKENAF